MKSKAHECKVEAKHTPTLEVSEWGLSIVLGGKETGLIEMPKKAAAFIVRACNSHEALINALDGVLEYVDEAAIDEIAAAKEALKQAEGK